jgi:hypothetical protein
MLEGSLSCPIVTLFSQRVGELWSPLLEFPTMMNRGQPPLTMATISSR